MGNLLFSRKSIIFATSFLKNLKNKSNMNASEKTNYGQPKNEIEEKQDSLYETEITDKIRKFGGYFSENNLLDKLRKVAKTAGATVIYPVLLLVDLLKSSDVPFEQKTIIVGALGYFILPLDIIPDAIPVSGYADDAAALLAVLKAASSAVTPQMQREAKGQLHQWLGDFDEQLLSGVDMLLKGMGGRKNTKM